MRLYIIIYLTICSTKIYSQDQNALSDVIFDHNTATITKYSIIDKKTKEGIKIQNSILFSVGLTSIFGSYPYKNKLDKKINYNYNANTLFLGPLSIIKNVIVSRKLDFNYGLNISYFGLRYKNSWLDPNNADLLILGALFGGSFHFSTRSKFFDPYIKVIIGLNYFQNMQSDFPTNSISPGYGLLFGTNLLSRNNTALNIEVGYDQFSYIKIGYLLYKKSNVQESN